MQKNCQVLHAKEKLDRNSLNKFELSGFIFIFHPTQGAGIGGASKTFVIHMGINLGGV